MLYIPEVFISYYFHHCFPCGSNGKESACHGLGLIPELGRSVEKGKVTHSSILAWGIKRTVKSMGLQRVGHD